MSSRSSFAKGSAPKPSAWTGRETFGISLGAELKARMDATLSVRRGDGRKDEVPLRVRIDTPIEVDYYRHGGILPFVLRQLIR